MRFAAASRAAQDDPRETDETATSVGSSAESKRRQVERASDCAQRPIRNSTDFGSFVRLAAGGWGSFTRL